MTIRNLDTLFNPRSIALIGASQRPGSIGLTVARNLLGGGFKGPISFVNPHGEEILGVTCVASVAALPSAPDLAVIATPPATIPALAAELAAKGTKAIVVISAGVTSAERQAILDAGRDTCVRVLGPNCIGLLVPPIGLDASFSHRAAPVGKLAFLSQSGALVTAIIDWAAGQGVGFSHVVSLGDMADVDFGDLLDYLAADRSCSAILMYVEAITNARKFMSAARRAARVKPVIAIKSGRHASAARAATSHTGALAGSDAAYDAAFHRAGVLRVPELLDLFAAAEMISHTPRLGGERLAILTNGGGAGVLATDALGDYDGTLADLSRETLAALNAALPPTWSHGNPIDIIGDADGARYLAALDAIVADPGVDAVLVMNCPTALAPNTDIARAVVAHDVVAKSGKAMLTNWLGADGAADARRMFTAAGIPTFDTPAAAVDGYMQLVRYRRSQDALMRSPAQAGDFAPADLDAARAIIAKARDAGRLLLSEVEGKALLDAHGIPVVDTRVAATPEVAMTVAKDLLTKASQVALKILSDDITHKSDVGGVRLGLASPEAVGLAARAMLAEIRRRVPDARIAGFTLSPMITRPNAFELILGVTVDRTFGPLLLFGAGGTAVEVIGDTALALPPLDMTLADGLVRSTRISRQLAGYRDRAPADGDAIRKALVRLSTLVTSHPEILELDINPLLADASGVIALDARVKLAAPGAVPRAETAIMPYPDDWVRTEDVGSIGPLLIRPIRPDDEANYLRFFDKVTMEDRRLRLFAPVKELAHGFVARMTQIDYAREIAFVAIAPKTGEMLGVVRYTADPDMKRGEFGALVRSDLKGHGVGWRLMHTLIEYARGAGLETLTGDVLRGNETMLKMCDELGFVRSANEIEHDVVRVDLQLAAS